MTKLFVYGTLKQGYSRAAWLEEQTFVGDAATVPGYKLYDNGSYPAMIGTQCHSVVTGELWKVDSRCLVELDKIEGVPALYQRVAVKLSSHPGESVQTYLYCQSLEGWRDIGCRWPAETSGDAV